MIQNTSSSLALEFCGEELLLLLLLLEEERGLGVITCRKELLQVV
jgi:hypothetical protein